MKKYMLTVVIGCLFLIPALVQTQWDKKIERFFQREESRIRPDDLRVLQLEFSPDPLREGQWISFRVTIANDSDHSGKISLTIKDRDDIVSEVKDVNIYPRENRIDFPDTYYRFSRSDPNLHYFSSQFSGASYADDGQESGYYTEGT